MEHELRALRLQLREKSIISAKLQKEVLILSFLFVFLILFLLGLQYEFQALVEVDDNYPLQFYVSMKSFICIHKYRFIF